MIKSIWSKFCLKVRGFSVRQSILSKPCKIGSGSNILAATIGKYSYCGYDCWIVYADIGAFCSIANNVRIGGASHPLSWVSTSPVFYDHKNVFRFCFANNPYEPYIRTYIGNDVWIGEGAIILSGLTIETGAVIGAGSVVTKDVGAYEVWAGNPARLIKKRTSDENIKSLLQSEWWLLDEQKLWSKSSKFNNIDIFLNEEHYK